MKILEIFIYLSCITGIYCLTCIFVYLILNNILRNQVAIFILLGQGHFSRRHIKKIIKKAAKGPGNEVGIGQIE